MPVPTARSPHDVGARHDLGTKLARVRGLLESQGAASIVLTSRASLEWLLDGPRLAVPLGGEPVLSAVVTRTEATVHVAANEVDRLVAEDLAALTGPDLEVQPVPWFEPLPGRGARGGAADLAEVELESEVRALRAPLLDRELDRFRALGAGLATAVTGVLSGAAPTDTERDLAARLTAAIMLLGAEPTVVLVAGVSRLDHRHPVPTAAPLGRRAMAVVGARRDGLVASMTRWLGDEPGAAAVDARLYEVEADAFAATRPGRLLREVFDDVAVAYGRHGFDRDEWLRHHQGGPTGYAGRDPRAGPAAPGVVVDRQAFAWNPTAARHKVEDTVVVDRGRVEVLTVDPRWPTVEVHGLARPRPMPFG